MKIAVLDSDSLWRGRVKKDIKECLESMKQDVEIFDYSTGKELLAQGREFDMLFTDIEMEGINGFDTIYSYKQNFPNCLAVIVTMHNQFSCAGYKVGAFRYLSKIKMREEIEEALASGMKMLKKNKKMAFHIISVGKISLAIKDIYYIETEKRNIQIHTRDRQYLSNHTISELELQLKDYGFCLVHKSTLVNLDAIEKIDGTNRKIQLYNGSCITVARQRIPELKKKFIQYTFDHSNLI